MTTRRKSTLFLIELLIVIAVFALCAAACVRILTASHRMAVNSIDRANALIIAQNYAEVFKATGGDTGATVAALGGRSDLSEGTSDGDGAYLIQAYFDSDWQHTGSAAEASFLLSFSGTVSHQPGGTALCSGEVSVEKTDGEPLISLAVAVRS